MLSDKELLKCEQWLKDHGIVSYKILDNGEINVFSNVFLRRILSMNIPYQFNEVHGNFTINETNLNNLIGFPRSIAGYMKMNACGIHSMEGYPTNIGIEGFIASCSIESLRGIIKIDNLNRVSMDSHVVLSNTVIKCTEDNYQVMYENITPDDLDAHMEMGFDFSFDVNFRKWVLEKRRVETINAIANEG